MRTRRLMECLLILGALTGLGAGARAQSSPYLLANSPVTLLGNSVFPLGMLPIGPGSLYNAYLSGIPGLSSPTGNRYNVSFGPGDIPRTSDTIEARLESGGKVGLSWQGEPRAVKQITFALLDKNRKPIRQETISKPPAAVSLPAPRQTAYYAVIVEYINGTTTSVISPLHVEKPAADTSPAADPAAPASDAAAEKPASAEEEKQASDPAGPAQEPKR